MMEAPDQRDLFGIGEPIAYPDYPGSRSAPASREAARKIAPRAGPLRRLVLDEFRAIHPAGMSADEAATALECSILSIRPRVSELRKAGLLEPTPQRSRNASGLQAHQLRATRAAMAQRG